MKKITIAIIILFIILFYTQQTMAASNLGLFVSPPTQAATIPKGTNYTGNLTLINDTTIPLQISTTVNDFIINNTEGIPQFLTNNLGNRFSATDWIKVSNLTFSLAPQEKRIVQFTITVPTDSAAGGHYAAIIFSANGINKDNTSNARVIFGVASLISITVPGNIRQSLIGTMEIPTFQEYGPVKIQTTLSNTGDIDLNPQGSIIIKNILGQVISNIEVERKHIFPEASKTYTFTLPGKWHMGKYTTILNLQYGDNQTLTTQATFIIFPWSLIIILTLSAIAFILLMLVMLKKKQSNPNIPEPLLNASEK